MARNVLVFSSTSCSRQTFIANSLQALHGVRITWRSILRDQHACVPLDCCLARGMGTHRPPSRWDYVKIVPIQVVRRVSSRLRGFIDGLVRFDTVGQQIGAGASFRWIHVLAKAFRFRADVILVHFAWNLKYAIPFSRVLTSPIAVVVHGSDIFRDEAWKNHLGDPAVRTIIAVSPALLAEVHAHRVARTQHMLVVNNAISPLFLSAPSPPPSEVRVVCVSSLTQSKNHAWLLRALAILRDRGVDFTCDLVGKPLDGQDFMTEQVRQQAHDLRLADRVRFHGWQEPDRVRDLIDGASTLVLPSQSEGFGMVLIEAIARQRRPVATRLLATTYATGDGRFAELCDLDDDHAMADAIVKAHGLTIAQGDDIRAGRAWVEQEFSQARHAERMAAALFPGR